MTDDEERNWTPETDIMKSYLDLDLQYEVIYKNRDKKVAKVKLNNDIEFALKQVIIKSSNKLQINNLLREYRIANLLGRLTDGIAISWGLKKKEVGEYTVIEILMEYGGIPLSTFVNKGELEEGDTMNIACQLLSILTLMEELGMSHLDIKLPNIVWNKNKNRVKLIDFGISLISFGKNNEVLKEVDSKKIVGYTKSYSAPEIKKKVLKVIPQKLDVYSFGVTFLKLLAAEHKIQNLIEYDTDFFIKKFNIDELKEEVKRGDMDGLWEVIYKAIEDAPQSRPTFRKLREVFLKQAKGMTKDDYLLDVIDNLNDHTIKIELIDNLKLNNIYQDLIYLYDSMGNCDMEVKCLKKYLKTYSKLEGEESSKVAYSYYRLAYLFLYTNKGEKSISYLEKALSILLRIGKKDNPLLKAVYILMGLFYTFLNDYEKAKKQYDEAFKIESEEGNLEMNSLNTIIESCIYTYNYEKIEELCYKISKEIKKEEHVQGRSTTWLDVALGLAYYYKGDFKLAKKKFNEALNKMLSEYGEQHPYLIYVYFFLGTPNILEGCFNEGIKTLDKCLSISLAMYEETHLYTILLYIMKAILYKNKGDYNISIDLCNKSLNILLRKLGSQNIYTLMSYLCLGELYFDIGDFIRAKLSYSKGLDIAVKIIKKESVIYVRIYDGLGILSLIYESNIDKGIDYCNKALNMALKIGYKDSPFILTIYNNLVFGYYLKRDCQEVIKLCKIGLNILLMNKIRRREMFAIFYYCLGTSHFDAGEKELGIHYINEGLKTFLSAFGNQTMLTSKVYSLLEYAHQIRGDRVRALEVLNESSKIPETATIEGKVYAFFHYGTLAYSYRLNKDFLNVKASHEQALKISLDLFGELHFATTICFYNLGTVYAELENIKEAEEYLNKALSIQVRTLSETHYLTGHIYFNLAMIYRRTNRYEEALYTLCKSIDILDLHPNEKDTLSFANKMMQELCEITQRGN